MPKKELLPDYETDQMVELIRQHIHNRVDRRMLVLRLIDGCTFSHISQMIYDEFGTLYEEKTVRTRIHKAETIVFSKLPG